jgi:hypothetical protein
LVHFSHFGTMYQRKIWQPWLCRDESEIINEFDHGNLWELLFLMGTTFLLFLNLKDSTLVAEWIQGDQIGRSNFAYFLLAGFWQWRMYIDHVLGYFLSTEKLWFILTRIGFGHFLGHFFTNSSSRPEWNAPVCCCCRWMPIWFRKFWLNNNFYERTLIHSKKDVC